MTKRLLSSFLAAAMLLSLVACGKTAPARKSGNTYVRDITPPETAATETIVLPFPETVIVDNEDCTFTISSIEADGLWGYTLKVFLENRTDLDLMFALELVSVNGFMCDPFWSSTVTAGMKANENIIFSASDFQKNGITDVTEIAFQLCIYDSNNWETAPLVDDSYVLYPMGEDAVLPYHRTAVEGERILFDNENCTMIITGYDPDNLWGYTVNVYLENKTEKELMFSVNDAAVNGFMCDPFWAAVVAPGKRSNTSISWMISDFESNGITSVESLTLPIRVYDNNDWLAPELVKETFTVIP